MQVGGLSLISEILGKKKKKASSVTKEAQCWSHSFN